MRIFFHADKTFLTDYSTVDAEMKGPSLVGTHGYHRFPLSKPVVGQNIALHAAPAYRTSTLPGFCLPGSFNFIFSTFLQSSTMACALASESDFSLVVEIHFLWP